MNNAAIRVGCKADVPRVYELIRELAEFEKALDKVDNSVEQLTIDGFGENPAYGLFVCEVDKVIVGIALYYHRYSTWKGRRLYLEDIIITKSQRGKGYGKLLFDRVVQYAREEKFTGMMWQVLDWNESAIRFYRETYNARLDSEWINCHLDF